MQVSSKCCLALCSVGRMALSWGGKQRPQPLRFTVYLGVIQSLETLENPQRRVLTNRRKAVGFQLCQEDHITSQWCCSMTNAAEPHLIF